VSGGAGVRIFYCPKHGRITEAQFLIKTTYQHLGADCRECRQWYHQQVKYKAKRTKES
jgi:hypothetical protein